MLGYPCELYMVKYVVTAFVNKIDNKSFYRRDIILLPRDTKKEAEDYKKRLMKEIKTTIPQLRNYSQIRVEKISDKRAETIK